MWNRGSLDVITGFFCEFILPSAREWYAAKKLHNALIIASNRLGR